MGNIHIHRVVDANMVSDVVKMLSGLTHEEVYKKVNEISPSTGNPLDPMSETTPLVLAVQNANYDMVKLLLDLGADPNIVVPGKDSSLYFAINNLNSREDRVEKYKDYDIITALIDKGADVNWDLSTGEDNILETAFIAFYRTDVYYTNHAELVKVINLLIKNGANKKVLLTKLRKRVENRGNDIRHGNEIKKTIINLSMPTLAEQQQANRQAKQHANRQAKQQANRQIQLAKYHTSLAPSYTVRGPSSKSYINSNNNESIKARGSSSINGSNNNESINGRNTPYYSKSYNKSVIKSAIKRTIKRAVPTKDVLPATSEAVVNKLDKSGTWRLYTAARDGDYDAVVSLLNAKANPNKSRSIMSKAGYQINETPLYIAALSSKSARDVDLGLNANHAKIVKELLKHGANPKHIISLEETIENMASNTHHFSPAVNQMLTRHVTFRGGSKRKTSRKKTYRTVRNITYHR